MYKLSDSQTSNLQSIISKKEFSSFATNLQFAEKHNDVCPRCQKEFPIEKETIQKVGSYGVQVFRTKGVAIPYMLCKTCTHKMKTEPAVIRSKNNARIDNHLLNFLKQTNQ
ncbi:hypothetical protein [Bacillus bombysepticus]|uniref:hypothetical protein n=1 Tax=Bacillus bombysepticus TaxID=658666 RepID=UPI0030165E93